MLLAPHAHTAARLPPHAQPEVSQSLLAADGSAVAPAGARGRVGTYEAQAMRLATSQAPTLLQTGFFMWMIGNQISLWTIFFLVQMGTAPFRALLNLKQGTSLGPWGAGQPEAATDLAASRVARPHLDCPCRVVRPGSQCLRRSPSPART